jgi:hypothetical protein
MADPAALHDLAGRLATIAERTLEALDDAEAARTPEARAVALAVLDALLRETISVRQRVEALRKEDTRGRRRG